LSTGWVAERRERRALDPSPSRNCRGCCPDAALPAERWNRWCRRGCSPDVGPASLPPREPPAEPPVEPRATLRVGLTAELQAALRGLPTHR